MVYDRPKIMIVVDGKIEDIRFTENETKEKLRKLPIKNKDGKYRFFERVILFNKFFEILHSLCIVLYGEEYHLTNKFSDYEM